MSSSHQAGPYAHGSFSVKRIMWLVILALLPATLWGIYQFSWPALFLLLVAVVSALLAEAVCLYIAGKAISPCLFDGSAILTAWLLAMSLPPWAPWWIAAFGSAFAIIVGKHIFGGLGQNVFNPAMLARVVLLISFPLQMTFWVNPHPMFSETGTEFVQGLQVTFLGIEDLDSVSSASTLGKVKTGFTQGHVLPDALYNIQYNYTDQLLGNTAGSLGETSGLLILLGGLFLLLLRVITWHIPVSMLATVCLLAGTFQLIDPQSHTPPLYHLLGGGLMLGAFFIATDMVTSPCTPRGQLLFGAGCGALDYVIRTWGGYPEGIGFAVLIMNAATPLIDHYIRPRIYGRDRKGEPLATQPNTTPAQTGRDR